MSLSRLERPLLLAGLALVTAHLLDLALSGHDTSVLGILVILVVPLAWALAQPHVTRPTRLAWGVAIGLIAIGFGLLWLTPSKWTHHFGSFAALGAAMDGGEFAEDVALTYDQAARLAFVLQIVWRLARRHEGKKERAAAEFRRAFDDTMTADADAIMEDDAITNDRVRTDGYTFADFGLRADDGRRMDARGLIHLDHCSTGLKAA